MIKLRPDYQLPFVRDITTAWRQGNNYVLGVCPTGGGKTICFSAIIHDHTGASAAIVHRKEIVTQLSLALGKLDVKHRIVAPSKTVALIRRKHLKEFGKSFIDPNALCGVASVQTLTSASAQRDKVLQAWTNQVTLGVLDECHHYVDTGVWSKALACMPNAKFLGVTATPERADGKGLGRHADGFADTMVEGPTTQWLIQNGYLSKFKYLAPSTDLDVSGLATPSGDFTAKALRSRVVESHLVGDVVKHCIQFASSKRTIIFASDVQTAHEIAASFCAVGVEAKALSGSTEQGERDRELERFSNGQLPVLVNVDLFDEGFDVPAVECVVMARPTESLAKFLQMVGRSLRPVYAKGYDLATADGRLAAMANSKKPEAIIIDPVRNWERHGMPNWPRNWTLNGKESTSRGASDTIPQRVCTACSQPYETFYTCCPYCGAPVPEPSGRSVPEQVEGDLTELDVDGMAALFKAMEDAGTGFDDSGNVVILDDDSEYAVRQIEKRIPPVGRAKDMERRQAAKYRRSILKELIAWWVGAQPNRDTREIQRRFYVRFGIDMGTAMTLNAKETDALAETIKRRFTEDLA